MSNMTSTIPLLVGLVVIAFVTAVLLVGSGARSGIMDVLAQDGIDTKSEQGAINSQCDPKMSNATIPDPSEDVLPPEIYMIYGDNVYLGELSESKYRAGETFSDLDILPQNISSRLPTESVAIENGSCLQFLVRGTPSTLPPDSLDVSAYTSDGTPFGVLNASEDDPSTFRYSLPAGANILLATATWIPSADDEYVTGYVIYKFLTNATKN
jgi:hypothetical protein